MLLMDLSFSWKRNVSAFQASFFEMLSAWSASFLAGMTRISREMNHRACRERDDGAFDRRCGCGCCRVTLFGIPGLPPRQPDHFPIADHPRTDLFCDHKGVER